MPQQSQPLKFDKELKDYYQNIPKDYKELYQRTVSELQLKIPAGYYKEGVQRFEKGGAGKLTDGKPGYIRDTEFGPINQCYLPETDTVKDIREELLDALFNAMVLYFKHPESEHVEDLIAQLCETLTWLSKIERWGGLYVDMADGKDA